MVESDLATSCLLVGTATMFGPRHGRNAMAQTKVSAQDIVDLSKGGFLSQAALCGIHNTDKGYQTHHGKLSRNILSFRWRSKNRESCLFAAGPNWTDDEKSWEGDGMVVIRAKSLAEATNIMKRDPMHKSGARKFKIRPWFVNEGTVSVRLNYSQGTFEMI